MSFNPSSSRLPHRRRGNGRNDGRDARSVASSLGVAKLSDHLQEPRQQRSCEFRSLVEGRNDDATWTRRANGPQERRAYARRCEELRQLECEKPEVVRAYMTWRFPNGCTHFMGHSHTGVEADGDKITHEYDLYHDLPALVDSNESRTKAVLVYRTFREGKLLKSEIKECNGEAAFRGICGMIAIPIANCAQLTLRRLRMTIRDEQSGPMVVSAASSLTDSGTVLESIDIHVVTSGSKSRHRNDPHHQNGISDFGISPQTGTKLMDALCMLLAVNAPETNLRTLRISRVGMVGWRSLVPYLPMFTKLQELSVRGLSASLDMSALSSSLLKNSSLTNVTISCRPHAIVFSNDKTNQLDSYIQRNRKLLLTISRLQCDSDESKGTTTSTELSCVPYLFRAAMQTPQVAVKLILMGLLTAGPTVGPTIIP